MQKQIPDTIRDQHPGFAAATLIGDYGMKLLCMHTPYYDEAYIDDFKRLEELHGTNFKEILNRSHIGTHGCISLIEDLYNHF